MFLENYKICSTNIFWFYINIVKYNSYNKYQFMLIYSEIQLGIVHVEGKHTTLYFFKKSNIKTIRSSMSVEVYL